MFNWVGKLYSAAGIMPNILFRGRKTGECPRPNSNFKYNNFDFMYFMFWLKGQKKKAKIQTKNFTALRRGARKENLNVPVQSFSNLPVSIKIA